jgi:5-methylcytosine-specific restriction endonuclease McrBC regulatory subunit McrC
MKSLGARPRGRIRIGPTIARGGLYTSRLVHTFDELDEDTPDNRVLEAAAKILSKGNRQRFARPEPTRPTPSR